MKKVKVLRHKHEKKKRKKSHRSSSSSSSTSSSSSSDERHRQKRVKKRLKKLKKQEKKVGETSSNITPSAPSTEDSVADCGPSIVLMDRKTKAPETKEEYEKRQSVIRKVVDAETGRTRLIKGDGEILEEIVTKDQHKRINRQATQGDGDDFQRQTVGFSNYGWNMK